MRGKYKTTTTTPHTKSGGGRFAFGSPADVRPLPEAVIEVVVDELDRNRVLAASLVSYPVHA